MRTLTFGLLGAAAVVAGVLLARSQQRQVTRSGPVQATAQVEDDSRDILFLDRLRERGI